MFLYPRKVLRTGVDNELCNECEMCGLFAWEGGWRSILRVMSDEWPNLEEALRFAEHNSYPPGQSTEMPWGEANTGGWGQWGRSPTPQLVGSSPPDQRGARPLEPSSPSPRSNVAPAPMPNGIIGGGELSDVGSP